MFRECQGGAPKTVRTHTHNFEDDVFLKKDMRNSIIQRT